jgi:hypothetical protein
MERNGICMYHNEIYDTCMLHMVLFFLNGNFSTTGDPQMMEAAWKSEEPQIA